MPLFHMSLTGVCLSGIEVITLGRDRLSVVPRTESPNILELHFIRSYAVSGHSDARSCSPGFMGDCYRTVHYVYVVVVYTVCERRLREGPSHPYSRFPVTCYIHPVYVTFPS